MSVAVIVDTFPRWSERFIARELNELQRRGLDFTLYCLKAGDVDCERDPEFAGLIHRRVVLPSCFLPSFARELGMDAAAKERLKLVENELGLTAFRQIGCADSLTKLIREHRHKIVYAHFASLPSTLGWLAAEALKLPFVMSCHARDVFVDAQCFRQKLQYVRKIFTCNEEAEGSLRFDVRWDDLQGDLHKLVLMPHGLPLEHYPFSARKERAGTEKKRLLAAGRFVPKKGFGLLMDALLTPELLDMKIKATILGDGPERGRMMRQIARRCGWTGDSLMFPGQVLDVELRKYFNDADLMVVPSVEVEGDSDGLPNVLLEAFALGLPVVGTNAGSLSDVLNVNTGFVADARSPSPSVVQNLVVAIKEALLNPTEAWTRAEAARAVIEARFDIRKNIEPLFTELTTP